MSSIVYSLPPGIRLGERLARIPANDYVNVSEYLCLHVMDIPEHGHVRPVPSQHLLTVRVVLDEPHRPEPARALQAEIKATDAAEA